MKINLGSGNDYRNGYINIDMSESVGADLVLDVTKAPFPYEDNSVTYIEAIDFLEHIFYPVPVLNECHRVLTREGTIYIEVPLAGTNDYYKDPTHVRPFVEETFKYFADYARGYRALGCLPWRISNMRVTENRIFVSMSPDKE